MSLEGEEREGEYLVLVFKMEIERKDEDLGFCMERGMERVRYEGWRKLESLLRCIKLRFPFMTLSPCPYLMSMF